MLQFLFVHYPISNTLQKSEQYFAQLGSLSLETIRLHLEHLQYPYLSDLSSIQMDIINALEVSVSLSRRISLETD